MPRRRNPKELSTQSAFARAISLARRAEDRDSAEYDLYRAKVLLEQLDERGYLTETKRRLYEETVELVQARFGRRKNPSKCCSQATHRALIASMESVDDFYMIMRRPREWNDLHLIVGECPDCPSTLSIAMPGYEHEFEDEDD